MFNKLPNTSQVSVIVKLWRTLCLRGQIQDNKFSGASQTSPPSLQCIQKKREEIPKTPADSRLRKLNVYKTKQTNSLQTKIASDTFWPTINFAKQKIDHADSAASESAKKWQLIGRWLKCGDTWQHTLCMFGWCHNIKGSISVRSVKIKSSNQTQCTGIILLFTGSQRQIESGQMTSDGSCLKVPTAHRPSSCCAEVQDPCSCLNRSVASVWTVTNRARWHLCVDFHDLTGRRASYQLCHRWVGPPEPHTLWFDYASRQDNPPDY